MIYIPTITSRLRYDDIKEDYVLYSPNEKFNNIVKGNKITIWDNYTFYLYKRLRANKQESGKRHYLWLIEFIQNNWQDGITLVTPDVDWLEDGLEIEQIWNDKCAKYPQLYVPDTWRSSTDNLNIVGYALRRNSNKVHDKWNHCLGHIRNNLQSELLTYDSIRPLTFN